MPIYEYRCEKGHEVEVIQSMTEDALTECPECGAPTQRVLHSPAIHFKGSGFHNTDYGTRSGNKQKQAAAAAKKESGSSDSSSSSSDPSSSSSDSSSSSESSSSSSSSEKKSGGSSKDAGTSSK
ncbi:MAG: FmdB family zinc ribbon protein [Solirubrobacterales bacterium]